MEVANAEGKLQSQEQPGGLRSERADVDDGGAWRGPREPIQFAGFMPDKVQLSRAITQQSNLQSPPAPMQTPGACEDRFFSADVRLLSSWRGAQAALKCSSCSDSVTQDGPAALRVRAA